MVGSKVEAFIKKTVENGEEDSFVVIDLNDIHRKLNVWKECLPRIEPFYAVKCNDYDEILRSMAKWSLNFDCASMGEIKKILECGVDPSKIIYANPCKQVSHLAYAEKVGVRLLTADNLDELKKVKQHAPSATVILRLATDDSKSICRLSQKFGAKLEDVKTLLKKVKQLDLDFGGFSYHVGSGCESEASFVEAVQNARTAFDIAEDMGFSPSILDIGGGFSGDIVNQYEIDQAAHLRVTDIGLVEVEDEDTLDPEIVPKFDRKPARKFKFPEIARMISRAIEKFFSDEKYRIIAEPGRFFVHSAGTLAASVIARRTPGKIVDDDKNVMYYINEGVYGAFSNTIYDHAHVIPHVLKVDEKPNRGEKHYESSIWGPSCDGLDCVIKQVQLPKLKVGSWLYFENMGAYTICCLTNFNGFKKANVYCINSEDE